MDRVAIAFWAALLATAGGWLAGPVLHRAVPFYWLVLDGALGGLGRRLDKRQRSRPDLMLRGLLFTALAAILSYAVGAACQYAVGRLPFGQVTAILPLTVLLASGAAWRVTGRVYRTQSAAASGAKGSGARPYLDLARTTRIDFSGADSHALTREAVALPARLLAVGMIGPLAWFIAGGLPAAFLYSGAAAIAWQFGRNGFAKGFGIFPTLAEGLPGYLAALAASWLIGGAAILTPGARMVPALAGLLRRRGRAPYVQGGPPVTAMAYALGTVLGGPAIDLSGSAMPRAWAGPADATAQLPPVLIRRAVYLSVVAHLLLGLGLGVTALWLNLR